MSTTSVHLKACDISAAESHNQRTKDLDYVRKDLKHLNEFFSYIHHSLPTEAANLKREVKEKTGRKLQKNAIPIKEGVIVIDENTTMEDLKHFCSVCQNKFGMIPLQIYIHRDEGHTKAKQWKPNLHAHIEWRMYDTNGRNIRLSKDACSKMQTIASECLGMQRGKSSDKKHLSSLQFKIQQKEKELQLLYEQVSDKSEAVEKLKGIRDGAADLLTGKSKKKIKQLENDIINLQNKLKDEKEKFDNLSNYTSSIRNDLDDKNNQLSKARVTINRLKSLQFPAEEYNNLLFLVNNQLDSFISECHSIGLTIQEMFQLLIHKKLSPKDYIEYDGHTYRHPRKNKIHIRLDENELKKHNKISHFLTIKLKTPFGEFWYSVKDWISKVLDNNKVSKSRGLSR